MSQGKKIGLALLGIAVLGGVVAANVARQSRSKVEVQMGKVEKRDLVSKVSASGEIKPKKFVNVASNVSGKIVDLRVQEGERVKRGQIIARIDAKQFEEGARQSEAGLAASRAELDRAMADVVASRAAFERQKRMHADKLVSDQAFDQAEAELKMKEASVESQRRRVAQQAAIAATNQDNLEKTVVIAPMDGVITSLVKEEGETVIGAQSFQPTVICTVADLSVMEVEILVDETDIKNVRLGQEAEVRVDAFEELKVRGEVTEIGASAIPRGTTGTAQTGVNTGNQAKDFKVVVTLNDPDAALRPGLNATADIITARREGVTAVPIQAVVMRRVGADGQILDPEGAQGGTSSGSGNGAPNTSGSPDASRTKRDEKEGVFVVTDGNKAAFRPVRTGVIGESDIEILEGVKEGEQIVTGSYRTLRTLANEAQVKTETKNGRNGK
jgi:HlyD family secretion protein